MDEYNVVANDGTGHSLACQIVVPDPKHGFVRSYRACQGRAKQWAQTLSRNSPVKGVTFSVKHALDGTIVVTYYGGVELADPDLR